MPSLSQFKFGNPQSVLEMLNQMIPNYGQLNNPLSPVNSQYGNNSGFKNLGGGAFHFGQPPNPAAATTPPAQPGIPSTQPTGQAPQTYDSQDWLNGGSPPAPTGQQWGGMDGQIGLDPDALASLGNYQP